MEHPPKQLLVHLGARLNGAGNYDTSATKNKCLRLNWRAIVPEAKQDWGVGRGVGGTLLFKTDPQIWFIRLLRR